MIPPPGASIHWPGLRAHDWGTVPHRSPSETLSPGRGSIQSDKGGPMNKLWSILLWGVIAVIGAYAFAAIALHRGESVSAVWLVTAALAVYFLGYRFYSRFIAERVLQIDPRRATPAERHNDGMDYVPTNKWVLYGHHFAAIAGAGPLVGPVLAAQMGYLPGTLWILA